MSKENSNNQQGNNTKQPSKNVNNQSTSINRRGRDTSNHKTKKHQPNKKKTRTYTSRQNNETKNNEQNSANELKGNENLKGGLNIARKVATGNIIGATKSALKFKGNKKVRNKRIRNTIIQMLAPIIIIILLAGSIFAIFGSVFDTVKEVITGVIESIIDVFDGDVTDKPIEITDEQVDTIINSIEDLGVSAEDLKLLGDYDENATDEEKQEELRKYIREFYKAQLVTETLNYHHKENTDQDTYGAVYIYRGTDRSNRGELEYISYQDMQELQRSGDPSATKYFTIDNSGNLLIAYTNQTIVSTGYSLNGLGETSNEANIVFTTVDYRSAISQYTTKMNFLISLTMISQNPEFAAAVADLIKNSRIEISVMDKTTTRVRTEIHSYTLNEKEEDSDEIKSYDDLTYITRTTNVSTEPSINVTYVNTWFCEQSIAYEQIKEGPTEISNVTVNGENGSEEDGEEQWITNHTINTIETVETVKYLGKAEDVTFTLGQRGDAERYANGEIEEPTFIGLMETEFRIPYSKRTAEAGSNLVSGAEMLFSLLQKDPELENIETIMRYALYIYSGRDYGVTSLDGSIFEIREFRDISVSSNGLLKDYIRRFEYTTSPPTNADGTKYIIEEGSNGEPVVGYGVDVTSSMNTFIEAGYSTEIGAEVDIDFVDALEDQIRNNYYNQIKSITSGLNLTEYQIHALTSRAYNCGVSGAVSTLRGSPSMNFADSYNDYWNEETDNLFEEKNNNANFNHSLYVEYMSKPTDNLLGLVTRRESEWILFQTGYYNVLDQWYADAGNIIEIADQLHQAQITWTYSDGGTLYWNDIEMSINNPNNVTCCATFVSSVLYLSGLFTEEQMNSFNYNYCPTLYSFLTNNGWKSITSYDDLEPGDVVFLDYERDGSYDHVQLYAGNDTWYSDGSTDAIQSAAPYSQGSWARENFAIALRPN